MAYPIVMNLGVGRSGTTFVYNRLAAVLGDQAYVLHEDISARAAQRRRFFRCYEADRIGAALAEPAIRQWLDKIRTLAEARPVVITGSTTNHLAPVMHRVCGGQLRTIHIFRHPIRVSAASFVGAWSHHWGELPSFEADPASPVLTPDDPHARFRMTTERWSSLGPFARIAYSWLERTAAGFEFTRLNPSIRHIDLKAEDAVFKSDIYLRKTVELLEMELPEDAMPAVANRNAGWERSLEERPLGEAWRQIFDVPEVVELATRLGYGFEPADIEANTRKYQLPAGAGPWLRHHLRYWQARRRVVAFLRDKALIPQGRPVLGGGKPRSSLSALGDLLPSGLRRGSRNDAE